MVNRYLASDRRDSELISDHMSHWCSNIRNFKHIYSENKGIGAPQPSHAR